MECQFCSAVHDGDKVVIKHYLYEGDIYRVCFDHAEEKLPVDERKMLELPDLPDDFEIISTEKRRSLENDVNLLHFVEQAINAVAEIYGIKTGYRLVNVFHNIERGLAAKIKRYEEICFDYGIDADCRPFARPSSASCPKCRNKMFHLDGYRIKDALYVGMHETVKRCDVIVCMQCGHVFVDKYHD